MSAVTEQAIRDAVEAHFADEVDNGILRGWIVTMVGQAIDDAMAPGDEARRSSAHTLWLVAPGQILPMSIGIAHEFLSAITGLDRLR